MSLPSEMRLPAALRHELEAIRGRWVWLLILGIGLIVLGTIVLGTPFVASIVTAMWLGALLMVGGVFQIVGSFWTRDWSGFFLHLLAGVLYLVVGFLSLQAPVQTLEALTLLIASFLIVGGVFRIAAALVHRLPGRGWMLLHGLVSVVLGGMIWMQWPASSLWVIGLFVGIEMIFNGWTWVMLALGLRSLLPKASADVAHSPAA